MLERFLGMLDTTHYKMIAASGFLILAFVADAAAQIPPGWEDTGIKGMLIAAVVYLVRELAKQRDSDKAEAASREDRTTTALDKNSDTLKELITATNIQTKYFEGVAKVLIEKGSGIHHPNDHR